jgi:hypothetical protein
LLSLKNFTVPMGIVFPLILCFFGGIV